MGAVVRGDEACRLNDPLDGPGDKHPPGEAAGDAPQPHGTYGDLVALYFVDALYFVCHVRDSVLGLRDSAFAGNGVSPSPASGVPEGSAGETCMGRPVARRNRGLRGAGHR
jgi:hypothetical protein